VASDSTNAKSPPTYDCFVLSGGGAKGAYGAGVAQAVMAYRGRKGLNNPICYVGTSAGALNAYLLATAGPGALIQFWLSATNSSVLGVWIRNSKFQATRRWTEGWFKARHPYSIYSNHALTALVKKTAHLDSVHAPLIVTATDITQGRLKSFYVGDIISNIVDADAVLPENRQRFAHFRRIDGDDLLTQGLVASAAIPIFFLPVKITATHKNEPETSWHVDGGVGNHTPTREAAYFLRSITELRLGAPGVVYCVKQDPPRVIEEGSQALSFADILKRTLDVYHYVHMEPIIRGWYRINTEVQEQESRVRKFREWIRQRPIDKGIIASIEQAVTDQFSNLGGRFPRIDTPLIEIEPSTALGDSLDFRAENARTYIRRGYGDTLAVLRNAKGLPATLDDAEYRTLVNLPLFPGGTP
jgi:predicted acylesterase/phospholipase RssA